VARVDPRTGTELPGVAAEGGDHTVLARPTSTGHVRTTAEFSPPCDRLATGEPTRAWFPAPAAWKSSWKQLPHIALKLRGPRLAVFCAVLALTSLSLALPQFSTRQPPARATGASIAPPAPRVPTPRAEEEPTFAPDDLSPADAARLLADGKLDEAGAAYGVLATRHPDQPVYSLAARLLAAGRPTRRTAP